MILFHGLQISIENHDVTLKNVNISWQEQSGSQNRFKTQENMLIQGIGDEVISVIIALVVVGIISLVWLSTHVQDRPLVRAVVIRSSNNPNEVQEIQIASNPTPAPPPENELREAIEATESSLEAQQDIGQAEDSNLTSNNGEQTVLRLQDFSVTQTLRM